MMFDKHGELDVQRHAIDCLWPMDQGKVYVPPARLTATLKGEWSGALCFTTPWPQAVAAFEARCESRV